MNGSPRLMILLASVALILAGCAARKPGFDDLYARLKEKPGTLETGVLAGRTIVIDPGHGGSLPGALGADSLREADANLGVALYLWGLCKDAGANAHLTRTTDRDLLPAGSQEPGDDLRTRIATANGLDADVFVSIHHNANLPVKRDVNKIEVYYRASDPGASLELAEDIQVHLARNLGIETSEIKPGSYLVLRLSTARAAILGEASFLSHPAVEERLKLSAKQKLEAEAYFLGLVDYFSRGIPEIARISPSRDTLSSPAEISFSVQPSGGSAIDPVSARIEIGALRIAALFDPVTSTMRVPLDPGFPNGTYSVAGSARSTGGGTARSRPYTILLARPARFILPLAPQEKPQSIVALSVAVLDATGMHVADGTPMTAISHKDGTSRSGVCTNGTFAIEVARELAREAFTFRTAGATDTVRFAGLEERPRIAVLACDARTGSGIAGAVVLRRSLESVAGDAQGRILVPSSGAVETLLVSADGYRPFLIDTANARGALPVIRAALEPIFGGVLREKRIALDPAGGGTDAGGRGTMGLRGATVNLAVARHLRDLLERAGATVILTREGDEPISAQERVYAVNRSGADLALGLRHASPPQSIEGPRCVLHYPSSERGQSIADALAFALGSLPPGGPCTIGESAGVFLQQTACTACEIYCGPIEDELRESLMAEEPWLRLEAEKIFAAVAGFFGYEAVLPFRRAIKVVSRGVPVAGALVDVDRICGRTTDADGAATFELIDPGMHLVTVRTIDGRSALFMRMVSPDEPELLVELP
jgi:N-acetylmuramoyl-L-alanine amidase